MPFNLFRKKKQPEQEAPSIQEPQQEAPTEAPQDAAPEPTEPPQEQAATTQEQLQENPSPVQEQSQEQTALAVQVEQKPTVEEQSASKTYLKAMPLKELPDIENVKNEVRNGNIVILRVTPLASKNIEDVKSAVNELYQFTEEIGGDIARLGEERVVICPKSVRIWREKTPAPVSGNEPLPTAA